MKEFKTLKPFMQKNWPHYFFGVLTLILVDMAGLMVPQVYANIGNQAAAGTLTWESLRYQVILFLILSLASAVGRYIWRNQIFGTSRKLDYWLRDKLFKQYLGMDQSFYSYRRTGELMALATNDISSVFNAMGGGVLFLTDAIFMTIATVFMMVRTVGGRITAVALVSLPFIALVVTKLFKPMRQRSRIVQDAFSDLTTEVQENLSGIRVIKATAIEDNRAASFEGVSRSYRDKFMDLMRVDSLFDPAIDAISGISFVVFIIYGSRQVVAGQLQVGSFIAVFEYLYRIVWPMIAIGLVINSVQRGVASMQRLNEIFRTRTRVSECKDPIALTHPQGEIVFDHVSFRYADDSPWILRDVSFTLHPGQSLAVLGRTGAGKTTMVALLLRLYDVTEGRILLDGIDIRDLSFQSLYESIGLVSQDNFLFSRTIAENIAFSEGKVDQERVREAARFAHVDEDILAMPQGYDTEVGERGVTLSGGQKQRICIARAYYKQAPVLVLDDSLSAVDTKTEAAVLDRLEDWPGSLFIISQRVSTAERADQILILEEGKISQKGKHEELVQEAGYYHNLFQRQLLQSSADAGAGFWAGGGQ